MNCQSVIFGLILFFYSVAGFSQQQNLRPITIEDYFQINEVRNPQISPDGLWIAYETKTSSLKDDQNKNQVWVISVKKGKPILFSNQNVSAWHPLWSPDGKYIAFLFSQGEGKIQVMIKNKENNTKMMAKTLQDVEDFSWSPDGKRLVLVLRDLASEDITKNQTKTQKPWVIDRLQFKLDEIGYLDHRRKHLYVFDIKTKNIKQITSGEYDDENPVWSPDGKFIAFTSNRLKPDPDATDNTTIWIVAADNSDKGTHVVQISKNQGCNDSPTWSPDGKWIAYVTQLDPHLFQYGTQHLAVSDSAGKSTQVLTLSLDRNVTQPLFSPDSKTIYFIADDEGASQVFRITTAGKELTRTISGRFTIYSFSIDNKGDISALISTPDRSNEIYLCSADSNKSLQRITHVNDGLMSQVKLSKPDYVRFKSKDGTLIAGYIYKPLNYVPGKRYPTLLLLHGGPVFAYYAEFNHVAQLFAANGYVVLLPNPRGSSGYGQKFSTAIFADWGNKDGEDDLAMVDYAIQLGISDPEKLGIGGHSYGADVTNFIITKTKRFKAAISDAGQGMPLSLYGHDQWQQDYRTELGFPWENRDLWQRLSPFFKVKDITTPTLFIGGEIDWNTPILGSEQMYQALKALGRPTLLVVYPGESHVLKTPSYIKDRLERYLNWYDRWVKKEEK